MKIRNANIICEDFILRNGDIKIENGKITGIYLTEGRQKEESKEYDEYDAEGMTLIPGLIDIHFHGALGEDFCDGNLSGMRRISEYELRNGITSMAAATLTLSEEELCRVLRAMAEWKKEQGEGEAELLGINMEGPFISHVKKGAQNERFIRGCDIELAEKFLSESEGLVKLIGIAPEENPGFEAYVREIKDRVKISLAHSNADYKMAKKGFQAGMTHAVHLFNAMTGLHHRDPGAVGAVFDSPGVTAELIADGVHIHPFMVRLAFQMLGEERVILISDSLRSTGMPDGRYNLGGQEIEKNGKYCRLVSDGNIAGSASNLMDCLRIAVLEMGIPLETAVRAASLNPAVCLGVSDDFGSLSVGKKADVVLLDKEMNVRQVWKNGKIKI